ncbi:SulP family inorganic anion transporter [soil metagenome]
MALKRKARYYRLLWLKHDLPAGLSVFLVALPLCLGIALASGAPLYAGIISGVIGGMVVSFISGSALGVSGPAAGLTTIVAASIIAFGDYHLFLLTVILAGIFQILLGILKMGSIANYFPAAVIRGMLAAIGIMLISKQIPLALGYNLPNFWSSGFLQLFTIQDLNGHFEDFNHNTTRVSILITLVSITILILFKQSFAKKVKLIPPQLWVVLAGVLLNEIFGKLDVSGKLRAAPLVNIPQNIFAEIQFPDLTQLFTRMDIILPALTISLLASLETLLCAEAIDKLDKQNRITPVNRELIAQGVGNMLCGMLGAIPMTAVIVRGAANVDAGGRTRLASFTHGILLLLTVIALPFLLNKIPFAALAAILLMTGYNLAKPKLFKMMWKQGWTQFLPFIITIVSILLSDLLIGVCIGLTLSIYFIIRNNFRSEFQVEHTTQHITEYYNIRLSTHVNFLNKVKLREALEKVPAYSVLTIDGTRCNFIDQDVREMLHEYSTRAKSRHMEVHLQGINLGEITKADH